MLLLHRYRVTCLCCDTSPFGKIYNVIGTLYSVKRLAVYSRRRSSSRTFNFRYMIKMPLLMIKLNHVYTVKCYVMMLHHLG